MQCSIASSFHSSMFNDRLIDFWQGRKPPEMVGMGEVIWRIVCTGDLTIRSSGSFGCLIRAGKLWSPGIQDTSGDGGWGHGGHLSPLQACMVLIFSSFLMILDLALHPGCIDLLLKCRHQVSGAQKVIRLHRYVTASGNEERHIYVELRRACTYKEQYVAQRYRLRNLHQSRVEKCSVNSLGLVGSWTRVLDPLRAVRECHRCMPPPGEGMAPL